MNYSSTTTVLLNYLMLIELTLLLIQRFVEGKNEVELQQNPVLSNGGTWSCIFKRKGRSSWTPSSNSLTDDFDLDDGVYFQGTQSPVMQRPAPQVFHDWVINAVDKR
jgi:hypothetical protein